MLPQFVLPLTLAAVASSGPSVTAQGIESHEDFGSASNLMQCLTQSLNDGLAISKQQRCTRIIVPLPRIPRDVKGADATQAPVTQKNIAAATISRRFKCTPRYDFSVTPPLRELAWN
jgi:hypothetical protein